LPSGWMLSSAHGVNEMEQIVGQAKDTQGVYHAYLLNPVPEPSTLVLLDVGIIGLLAYVWRWLKSELGGP
jgi:hypothetical protein